MDFETHTALMSLPRRHDDALCQKDITAYAECFTEDAVWDAGHLFVEHGKQAIVERMTGSFDHLDWVVRMPTSTVILECDGNTARIRTYFVEFLKLTPVDAADAILSSTDVPMTTDAPILNVLTYLDDCVKEPDGQWRIKFHKLHIVVPANSI